MKRVVLCLCLPVLFGDIRAQIQQNIATRGEEVMVDVVVRDKKGRAVTDLTQSDFEVFDNGEKRSIQSFRLVQGSEGVDPSGARKKLDPLRQLRLVTLIFDRLDLNGRRLSRQAALDLLQSDLPQNVYMAVFALDQKLEALQAFTNDRELLRKAVERATSGSYSEFGADSDAIRQHLEQAVGPNQTGGQSLEDRVYAMPVATGPHGEADPSSSFEKLAAEIMLQTLEFDQRSDLAQTGRASISGLLAAVRAQYQLPGRKTILYFSEGFGVPQGMEELFKTVISTANNFNVSFYSIDAHGLSTTSLNQQSTEHLSAALANSRENGLARPIGDNHITTASALSTDTALDSGQYNTQDILAILAESTGGTLIANTNDFRGPLHKVGEDIETYYELSYSPNIEKYDGTFRKISVKTNRADLRIQSRAGYFALPPSIIKGDSVLNVYEVPLLRALSAAQPAHSFDFESGGLYFRGDSGNQTCGFLIEMPLKNMTLGKNEASGVYEGGASYVALIKDASGQVVKKLQGDVPVKLDSAQVPSFQQSQFTDMEYFDVSPGKYTIEVAMLDRQSGKISARRSVLVIPPATSSLALSSVSLIRKWRAKEPDAANDDPFVVGGKTLTPTLTPTVTKSASTSLPFYLVIYPDRRNNAKPVLAIEFERDGAVKRVGAPPLNEPDAQGRIQSIATAPIEELQPGNYQVRFVVRQGTEVSQEAFSMMLEP